jgi:hypothetical protein
MASAISFGHANSGFQAGTINGQVNTEFHHHAPPGKLQGSKLTGANDGPSQSDQRPHRTRRSSYPSVATQTSSSEGRYLIRSIRNVLSQGPEPRLLAWAAWGEYERFGECGWLTAAKQVATRHRIRLSNSRPLAGDMGVLGPRKQCRPV